MSVLLINPSRKYRGNLDARAGAPPLGLLYVGSNLIREGYEVNVIDQLGSGLSDDKIVEVAKKWDPDLIGFSTMGEQTLSAGRLTKKLKDVLPNSKTLWGGINPTFNAKRIMRKYKEVDFCIKGEGELSTPALLKAMKNKQFDSVNGLLYREGVRLKEGRPRRLIDDLDSLPFPDRSLVKDIEYGSISGLSVKHFTSVLSSRGCPYSCKYCCCNALVNRRWRGRSVENVLDELEEIEHQGYKKILFFDDGLTLNKKRLIELCRGIRRRGIALDWFFEGRVDRAERNLYEETVKAGAKMCYFGAESASLRTLRYYNKSITPLQTKQAVSTARKAGMDFIIASFILGCPGESEADMDKTIHFMKDIDVDFVQVTSLHAYPGTALWDSLVQEGHLDPEKYWERGVDVSLVHPDSLPIKILYQKIKEAYDGFINHYKTKLKHIWRLIKSKFRRNIFFHNIDYFKSNLTGNLIGTTSNF